MAKMAAGGFWPLGPRGGYRGGLYLWLSWIVSCHYLVFDGKKENDSRNISSVKVSYLASAKFHKNNFRSAVEWITKKLLLLCSELLDNLAECCCWGGQAKLNSQLATYRLVVSVWKLVQSHTFSPLSKQHFSAMVDQSNKNHPAIRISINSAVFPNKSDPCIVFFENVLPAFPTWNRLKIL